MKILFPALRVSDLDTSLAFYTSVGLEAVGHVTGDSGVQMAMLAWPWDDEVSLELVDRPDGGPVVPGGFDHLAIQVDDLAASGATWLRPASTSAGSSLPGVLTGRSPRRCSTLMATASSSSSGRRATGDDDARGLRPAGPLRD
ncbi:VOC family protein [Pedococcus bigeumensis]|uniref:VOC family protein n=1 Tax=Pedococcus bigeumensis TaxID=433644 RepID=UPI0019D598C4|nr:VOC family protein [Pedococcus bigeumensis]